MAILPPAGVGQQQHVASFAKVAELIQNDPDALATMAAEAGLLPPEVGAQEPIASAQIPPFSGVAADGGGGPDIATFLQALQGVQAPPSPQTLPLLGAPSVPRGQIPQGSENILAQLLGLSQQNVPQSSLGSLILGL